MAKVALLIGVSSYNSDKSLSQLPAAEQDVEAMERVLLNPLLGGFERSHLKKLINPNAELMRKTIDELFLDRKENDFILFYFSGHGLKDEDDILYFATANTQTKLLRSTAVESSFVNKIMKSSGSEKQVIILDCCFSGAYCLNAKGPELSVDIENELSSKGRAVLASSTTYGFSFSFNESEPSIYTRYLVEGIETGAADTDRDGWISVDELHEYVKQKVPAEAQMEPEIYVDKQGYKIFIAKAPVGDPKVEYRQLVARYAEDSKDGIDPVSKAILEIRQKELKLTPEEAEEIIREVLSPNQDYQKKLDKYKQVVTSVIARENPLSLRTEEKLKELQQRLGLRNEDVQLIMEEVSQIKRMHTKKVNLPLLLFLFMGLSVMIIGGLFWSGIIPKKRGGDIGKQDIQDVTQNPPEPLPAAGTEVPLEKRLIGNPGAIESIAITANGKYLATGSNDGNIQLWNWREKEPQRKLASKENEFSIESLVFSPDGKFVVSAGLTNRIDIWEVSTGELFSLPNAHSFNVNSLAISPDGETLASGDSKGVIKIWNLETRELKKTLSTSSIKSLAISPDGKTLASGNYDATIKLWNLEDFTEQHSLNTGSGRVNSIIFKQNSQLLVSGSEHGTITLWNPQTEEQDSFKGHSDAIVSLDISQDGQKLASGSRDGTVKVWDLGNKKLLETYNLSDYLDGPIYLTFNANGEILVFSYSSKTIKIWIIPF